MTDLWDMERRLWTDGQDAFSEFMDMEAVMVFPEPIGILHDGDIMSEMNIAPKWTDCEMTDRWVRHRDSVVILNYRAKAVRADGPPYRAICTSVWQEVDGNHRIVAHQQTPANVTVDPPSLEPRVSRAGA